MHAVDPWTKPRVSICLPNLNTRPFLPERFQTIFDQSFQDWELLVYDSYSTDGAWEYISDLAARDPRIRTWQGPREGTPGSWSPCVRSAHGEYVYIATSDDTMAADCLEKLVAALDEHPDCDLAHCRLRPVDELGEDVLGAAAWWEYSSAFALSSGAMIDVPHLRKAPFDGLLHLLGGSVYVSITQLLIRRSLFDRIGFFERRWGSVGDFNWGMRAGLVANTVHVPDTWGGWRVHANQATAGVAFSSVEHARKIDDMIEDALSACESFLPEALRWRLAGMATQARELRELTCEIAAQAQSPRWRRAAFLARRLLSGSQAARDYVTTRLRRRSSADWVRRRLESAAGTPVIVPVSTAATVDLSGRR